MSRRTKRISRTGPVLYCRVRWVVWRRAPLRPPLCVGEQCLVAGSVAEWTCVDRGVGPLACQAPTASLAGRAGRARCPAPLSSNASLTSATTRSTLIPTVASVMTATATSAD